VLGIPDKAPLLKGVEPPQALGMERAGADEIAPSELQRRLDAGEATVVDFATSIEYRDGHIPGAWFAVRSRLRDALARIGKVRELAFTSPDGVLARLAALDAAKIADAPVRVLAGGTAAWIAAGLSLERGTTCLASTTDDIYYRPYDGKSQIEQAMKDYLDWEVALVEQLRSEPYLAFKAPPA